MHGQSRRFCWFEAEPVQRRARSKQSCPRAKHVRKRIVARLSCDAANLALPALRRYLVRYQWSTSDSIPVFHRLERAIVFLRGLRVICVFPVLLQNLKIVRVVSFFEIMFRGLIFCAFWIEISCQTSYPFCHCKSLKRIINCFVIPCDLSFFYAGTSGRIEIQLQN